MGKSTGAANCSVCGHAHWMADPHVWDDEPKKKLAIKEVLTMANAKVCVANNMANVGATVKAGTNQNGMVADQGCVGEGFRSQSCPSPTYKYRDAEKRKTYQRELMRKRRAEKIDS